MEDSLTQRGDDSLKESRRNEKGAKSQILRLTDFL